MTQNALTLLQTFFTQIFRIFTSIIVPGTNFTFASFMFFFAFVPLVLKFFCNLLGLGNGGLSVTSSARSATQRAASRASRNSRSNM